MVRILRDQLPRRSFAGSHCFQFPILHCIWPLRLSKVFAVFTQHNARLVKNAQNGKTHFKLIHNNVICCRRAKYLEQFPSCHSRSITVQSRFQETAEDMPVWMTIAALVRFNWRLRNVLTYLLTYLCHWPSHKSTFLNVWLLSRHNYVTSLHLSPLCLINSLHVFRVAIAVVDQLFHKMRNSNNTTAVRFCPAETAVTAEMRGRPTDPPWGRSFVEPNLATVTHGRARLVI